MSRSAAHLSVESVEIHRAPSITYLALSKCAELRLEQWTTAGQKLACDPQDGEVRAAERAAYSRYKLAVDDLVAYVIRPIGVDTLQ